MILFLCDAVQRPFCVLLKPAGEHLGSLLRGWFPVAGLGACTDSFLLAALVPDCIRYHPFSLISCADHQIFSWSWWCLSVGCSVCRCAGSDRVRVVRVRGSSGDSVVFLIFQNAFCDFWFLMVGMMVCIVSVSDLREGRGAVKRGQQKTGWRYGLTGDRCAAVLRRCRGEALRCVATRRHTWDTCAECAGEELEKTSGFRVNLRKWFALFQCTVNWSRARPKRALIAVGARRSSSICAGIPIEQCPDYCCSFLFRRLERITFNHSVLQSIILGSNAPGDATIKLDTV